MVTRCFLAAQYHRVFKGVTLREHEDPDCVCSSDAFQGGQGYRAGKRSVVHRRVTDIPARCCPKAPALPSPGFLFPWNQTEKMKKIKKASAPKTLCFMAAETGQEEGRLCPGHRHGGLHYPPKIIAERRLWLGPQTISSGLSPEPPFTPPQSPAALQKPFRGASWTRVPWLAAEPRHASAGKPRASLSARGCSGSCRGAARPRARRPKTTATRNREPAHCNLSHMGDLVRISTRRF